MKKKTVLVTGGAGFIGSHVSNMLSQHHCDVIVFDNLSTGSRENVKHGVFINGDLARPHDLQNVFSQFKIDAVMHFAALLNVGESVTLPLKYYNNNVANTLNLLEAMHVHRVKNLIFSSSAAIFGIPQNPIIDENTPTQPINPYGQSKLMIEKILQDCDAAYGLKSSCLRYFNAAGGDPKGELKNLKKAESNLIPLLLRNLKNAKHPALTVNGNDYPTKDGTCVRDYIHVEDLGLAHILAMEQLFKTNQSTQYNLGNGNGYSVLEVIKAAEAVTKIKINAAIGPRRPGDPAILIANSHKAINELGWRPRYPHLEDMIAHAWQALG